MIEATARAERYDPQTAPSPFYAWEVPQKPVSVRIPFALIDRLEHEAVESFRSLTSKGSEIGGLLVGSVTPGSPLVLSIADYDLIACDYSRGPLYRLSDADMGRFERAIEQRLATGVAIAGYFRSQTRKGIALDADDLTFFEARFRDPHQIALLVRPFATKASTAGIFIWEGGKINGDLSYLEFPFRSSELGAGSTAEAALSDGKAAPLSILTPVAPKPGARGQIVPIASRREISIPHLPAPDAAPVAAPQTPPPTASASVAPAIETKPPVIEDKPAKTEKPGRNDRPGKNDKFGRTEKAADKVEKAERIEAPVKPEKQEKQEKQEAPRGFLGQTETPAAARSGKSMKLLMAAVASLIVFVAMFVYPGFLRHSTKPAIVANPQDSSPLQLHVERTAGELLLTWNRDAEVIKNASKAVLSISDGEQHENVEMDLAQLRNGSIVYAPSSNDTSFKMEVVGKNNNKTASESVRVLRTRPSPLQDQQAAAAAAAPGTKPAVPAVDPKNAAATTPAAGEEAPEQPIKLATPSRPFRAEPLAQRLRPAAETDMPEAPSVAATERSFGSAIPGVSSSGAAPAPMAPAPVAPAPPAAATTTTTTQTKAPAKAGGQIQQAILIYKKEAEYPKIAKQTGAKGIVTLKATITKEGTVKLVSVISGHPMLRNSATEAVKQWRYRPTLLNGQPVETETEILVNFVGDK